MTEKCQESVLVLKHFKIKCHYFTVYFNETYKTLWGLWPLYHRTLYLKSQSTQWQIIQTSNRLNASHTSIKYQTPDVTSGSAIVLTSSVFISLRAAACRDCRIKTEPTQFYWSTDTRTRPEVSTLCCESPHCVLLIFSSQHAIKGNDNHTLCPANCWCPPPDAGTIPSACAQPGVRWDETLS